MGTDTKAISQMDIRELPVFFRSLADALEKEGDGEFTNIDDFRKFKISGKNEFGQVTVKVKFKSAGECDAADEAKECDECRTAGTPKYKHLKKRMKGSFRLIFKTIHEGQTPPAEVVESFLADSELMIGYPGFGDEYYAQYATVCAAFKAAFASGDLARMGEAIDAISHEKSRCHAKYD
jgi:XXXCH domain-containing protein